VWARMGLINRRSVRTAIVAGAVAVLAIGVSAVAGNGLADAKERPGLNKIVGGEPVAEDALPFMAHLTITADGGSFSCGGSLIREDVVLTAAHCIAGLGLENGATDAVEVLLGTTALDDPDAEVLTSTAVFSDPDFAEGSDGSLSNDWAVVKLAQASAQGQTVGLVGQGDTSGQEGQFTVAGWGRTAEGGQGSNELLQVDLDFFDDDTCLEKNASFPEMDPAVVLCAGTVEGGKDSCQGDSGGPLFKVVDGEVVQHGVVSFGEGCARADLPAPYTELAAFSDEIAEAADTVAATE
jgi:secreted trypsin-like serine protease